MPERARPSALYATSASKPHLFKSTAAIQIEKVRHRVIGDEEVHIAVVVDVSSDGPPCLAELRGNAGLFADIGECAVAVVMK